MARRSTASVPPVSPAVPPINEDRGEVRLLLDGALFGLRPSYEAIKEIERSTGLALFTMARAASAFALPLACTETVVAELIRAWGRSTNDIPAAHVDPERIGRLVYEAGLSTVQAVLADVLRGATTGGYTALGEPKATTTTAPSFVA